MVYGYGLEGWFTLVLVWGSWDMVEDCGSMWVEESGIVGYFLRYGLQARQKFQNSGIFSPWNLVYVFVSDRFFGFWVEMVFELWYDLNTMFGQRTDEYDVKVADDPGWLEADAEIEERIFILEDMWTNRRCSGPGKTEGVMAVHDRTEPWRGFLGFSIHFSMEWPEAGSDWTEGRSKVERTFPEVERFRSAIERNMMEMGMKSPEIPMVIWGRGQFEMWRDPGAVITTEYQANMRRNAIRRMKGRRI